MDSMKIGRLILTYREDLINTLHDFYLGKRTNFLVIAYNRATVNPDKFEQSENFKLVPYYGSGGKYGQPGGIGGQQYHVWVDVVKKFPEIDGWVIHDYDFIAKPSDADIFSHIAPNEYAMAGTAFPVLLPGMKITDIDTYPFPQSYQYWYQGFNPQKELIRKILMESYPVSSQGIQTIMGGSSDFIATSKVNILLLDDEKISDPELEGAEQIPHTIWRARGIKPVDMRKFYKMKVLLDVQYIPFSDKYDMLNPVKYWPGQKPSSKIVLQNLKYRFKKFIKQLIGYKGYRFGR